MLAFFLTGAQANADGGKITVNGEMDQVGCTVINSGNITVPLDPVGMSNLPKAGSVAGKKRFALALTCYCGTAVSLMLTSDNEDSYGSGTLTNTTGDGQAVGVGVQVLNSSGDPITFDQSQVVITETVTGQNDINFYAQYIRTQDSASAGNITTNADYTLSYD